MNHVDFLFTLLSFIFEIAALVAVVLTAGECVRVVLLSRYTADATMTTRAFRCAVAELTAHVYREIRSLGITYSVSATAADNWEAFRAENSLAHITVWSGASADTIFARPTDNYAFRALHDYWHLVTNQDFSLLGEARVADVQLVRARRAKLSHNARAILTSELRGQVRYHARHGRFPVDQKTFAWLSFRWGESHALQCEV